MPLKMKSGDRGRLKINYCEAFSAEAGSLDTRYVIRYPAAGYFVISEHYVRRGFTANGETRSVLSELSAVLVGFTAKGHEYRITVHNSKNNNNSTQVAAPQYSLDGVRSSFTDHDSVPPAKQTKYYVIQVFCGVPPRSA